MSSPESIQCENLVIGGGVMGLAIGAQLSIQGREVILIEAHSQFGQETSSRNSEVIHSGIYYPADSKKTAWCIEGRIRLYEFCRKHQVPAQMLGKYVAATCPEDEAYLDKLSQHCRALEVPHEFISGQALMKEEPLIKAHCGLFFPETGIVDSHQFMGAFERVFLKNGGNLAYLHRLQKITRNKGLWESLVDSPEGSLIIHSQRVFNAAGLAAAEISNATLGTEKYAHRYCRGRYFALSSKFQNRFRHLIYPVPQKHGLGVHVTLDFSGAARLGPDVDWASDHRYANVEALYDCDWDNLRPAFVTAAGRYCPSLKEEDLAPGLIGIRSKLFLGGHPHLDFLVENHEGFVHCLGIESPGLTSILAIARSAVTLDQMCSIGDLREL